MASSGFEFIRVDSFMDDINRDGCFDTADMDGTSLNYKFVLASDCPNDINSCIDSDGTLNDNVQIINTLGGDDGKCALLWSKGINGERTMSVNTSSAQYRFGDTPTNVKAVFLVNLSSGTGYVLAYSIKSNAIPISSRNPVFPTDGLVWTFRYGG